MERLVLAQVGCGGMGLRHVLGLAEGRRQGVGRFDLVAVCDQHEPAARFVADQAEQELGRRPRMFTDFDSMLRNEPSIEAVNIVTDTRMHHVFALRAMQAGKHIATEKPMGLTVRVCQAMIAASRKYRRVLCVLHNFRREPSVRVAKAAIEAGIIGDPWMMLIVSTMGTRAVFARAGWRHLKLRGGWMLESAVHDADMVLYLLGAVNRVTAETDIREKWRVIDEPPRDIDTRLGQIDRFYGHRVKEMADQPEKIRATGEDTALALLRFQSGAAGQMTFSIAAHGQPTGLQLLYGSEGSLTIPTNRTGKLPCFTPAGRNVPINDADLLTLMPQFELDEATARVFGGTKRDAAFELPFQDLDRKLIAIEMADFGDAISMSREPEVSGEAGLEAVALIYAILESGQSCKPVSMDSMISGAVSAYQQEINASLSL